MTEPLGNQKRGKIDILLGAFWGKEGKRKAAFDLAQLETYGGAISHEHNTPRDPSVPIEKLLSEGNNILVVCTRSYMLDESSDGFIPTLVRNLQIQPHDIGTIFLVCTPWITHGPQKGPLNTTVLQEVITHCSVYGSVKLIMTQTDCVPDQNQSEKLHIITKAGKVETSSWQTVHGLSHRDTTCLKIYVYLNLIDNELTELPFGLYSWYMFGTGPDTGQRILY